MNNRLNTLVFVFQIALACFLAFVAWITAVTCLWLALRLLGLESDYWALMEALSTAMAVATFLGASVVALREYNEIVNTRHIEIADRLFTELNSESSIRARRWIYENLPSDPKEGFTHLNDEGRQAIKNALNSLDKVAFLTQAGWIPVELIMPWINPMVVKLWMKLGPYVDYEVARRSEPEYYEYARVFSEECVKWRRNNVSDQDIIWLDKAL